MGFLDNVTTSDLSGFEPQPLFQAKQVIELMCTGLFENPNTGNLIIKSKVLNTEHSGKDYTVFIRGNPERMPEKKIKANFLKAFWTTDELMTKKAQLSKIVGRKYSVTASAPREYKGQMYQNVDGFVDLGVPEIAVNPETVGAQTTNVVY
jgi:hypothetical protein